MSQKAAADPWVLLANNESPSLEIVEPSITLGWVLFLVGFPLVCQSNLHFTVDYGWWLILTANPGLQRGRAFLTLTPVEPFADHINDGQQRENGNEDFKR